MENEMENEIENTEITEKLTEDDLFLMIKERRYDEIYVSTNENYWSLIYSDSGIEKSRFISKLYNEWRIYWDSKNDKNSKGKINELREESWRELSLLAIVYDDVNPIDFSYEINDLVLYPICVITMLNIFDLDCCIEEYLEYDIEN